MKSRKRLCRASTIWLLAIGLFVGAPAALSAERAGARRTIDLNGRWEIAEGSMDSIPTRFTHTVPVPGLVDMAEPAFEEIGKKSERRQAFWYRRTFTIDAEIPEVAILKIHKARYSTKVWLNGQVVEEVCVRIKNVPPTDNVIAFRQIIQSSETEFRKLGNVYKMSKAA